LSFPCSLFGDNSYSEYILKEKPSNDFFNFYLQTLEIAIADINNVVERTRMVQGLEVKLAKRLKRKKILETIIEKRERRKKVSETLHRKAKQQYEVDEEIMACEANPVDTTEDIKVREICQHFIGAINARALRSLNAFTPTTPFTFKYRGDSKYFHESVYVIQAFESFFDAGFRLYKEFVNASDVQWVFNSGVLRVQFEGYVVQPPDQTLGGRFFMQLLLTPLETGSWNIASGEITIV